MMTDMTHRLAMPLLHAGQAQKEVTHNEALMLADLAIGATVMGVRDTPPADPVIGEAWIVGDAPGGEWAGQARAIAGWTAGGWRYVPGYEGLCAWLAPARVPMRYDAGGWIRGTVHAERLAIGGVQVVGARGESIASPVGGATVDGEARTAIIAVMAALRTHGLIA